MSEARGFEEIVIYSRSTARLTFADLGLAVFLSALGGFGLGSMISWKALYDPAVLEKKRNILLVLGVSVAVLMPGLAIPFWGLFGKGYGTRLALNRATHVLDVQTVGFWPGTKRIESYSTERIYVLGPRFKEKSALTTPSIIFRRNNGDPKYADNLKSYMFERRKGWFKDEKLFQELAEGRYRPSSTTIID